MRTKNRKDTPLAITLRDNAIKNVAGISEETLEKDITPAAEAEETNQIVNRVLKKMLPPGTPILDNIDVVEEKKARKLISDNRQFMRIKKAERAVGMKLWREANGFSLADVAHAIGCYPMMVHRWEKFPVTISTKWLIKLEEAGYPESVLYMGQPKCKEGK